jgi:NAD(P)-dependent dehydrogenase (short-subunit alcohol dehydrogenase family)
MGSGAQLATKGAIPPLDPALGPRFGPGIHTFCADASRRENGPGIFDAERTTMYQPFNLTGRGAIVTGGNGGIGLGMASALLAAGATVAIWGSNPEKTKRAHQQLGQACNDASRVHAFVCDVGDESQVEAVFAQSVDALGRVDACFANAGVSSKGTPLVEMDLDEFRRVQRVNVEGVFLTFRAAARHMAQHGQGGSLVATASTAAVEGAARNSHYGASKGAVTSMVRALAVELARHKIRVNSILPGWIETDMTERAIHNPKFADGVMPRIPARRWGTIEDFGGIAVYLASDASGYATGEQFLIDGGYTKF